MLVQVWIMMVLVCLTFTVAAFLFPKTLFLPLICFFLWNSLAMMGTTLTYVGFGSMNVISQDYVAGDPTMPSYVIWFFHGIGMIMLIYGVGITWGQIYDTGDKLFKHQPVNTIRGDD